MPSCQRDDILNIIFEKSSFLQPVTDLLREMDNAGFFSHGLLIGSWPMLVYSEYFTLSYALVTNDIDFAVDNALKVPAIGSESIPEVLERLGYTAVQDYSGIETFLQGTFEVEFITHRKGGSGPPAVVIPPGRFLPSRSHLLTCFLSGRLQLLSTILVSAFHHQKHLCCTSSLLPSAGRD